MRYALAITALIIVVAMISGCGADRAPSDAKVVTTSTATSNTALQPSLEALEAAQLFRSEFGALYIDYYLALKRAELERYRKALADAGEAEDPDEVADWEQNEYLDFF